MSSPGCMVLHCTDVSSESGHEVPIPGEDSAPVCAPHWLRIDGGEPWLWVPGRRLKGVGSSLAEGCLLMGAELAGYGLVVEADVRMNNVPVFSTHLTEDGRAPTLAIDGRVFGTQEQVYLELVLSPQTATRLKEALRFFPT
jgi:hypothetical protein